VLIKQGSSTITLASISTGSK